jgi:membrane fusion protein, heavy metal efflux system
MSRSETHNPLLLVFGSIVVLAIYAGGLVHGRFLGHGWPVSLFMNGSGGGEALDDHAGHDHGHDHAGHDHSATESKSIELSESARKNIGLSDEYLQPIELKDYEQTIAVPAIVVDRPGRTRLPVSAATTGIVTHVHAVTGEAIAPGDLILEMRLTHEDLVTSQREFLQALGDRDVELREIARIESAATSGVISNKTLLERQYSRDKIESLLKSQKEALRLHGLSDSQIKTIETDRRLLTEIQVRAPHPDGHTSEELLLSRQSSPKTIFQLPHGTAKVDDHFSTTLARRTIAQTEKLEFVQAKGVSEVTTDSTNDPSRPPTNLLVLQDLHVQKGQSVNAGELLCTLADFRELLIEGQAFESEASLLSKTKLAGWMVSAIIEETGKSIKVPDLVLAWVDNEIDPVSRALKFYVQLPNVSLSESKNAEGQRYITWKYRTGQRMQLLLPIERLKEQIVLPVDAVVREGIESFVFQQNGDSFERIAVHEKCRDQTSVVIENDGALYPGDIVALRGAHQMHMAIKNKSGGAIDPHAGHSH